MTCRKQDTFRASVSSPSAIPSFLRNYRCWPKLNSTTLGSSRGGGAPPVILAAGRLVNEKDFPTLIRAFFRLRRQRPVRLIILGEGEERARLEALASALGVAEDMRLPGYVSNPFAYMSRAHVFAVSSKYEGLSNVLIEALACGCPVVSTNCPGGPPEILAEGKIGALVPVGDDAALSEAINKHKTQRGRFMRFSDRQLYDDYGLTHLTRQGMGLPRAKA